MSAYRVAAEAAEETKWADAPDAEDLCKPCVDAEFNRLAALEVALGGGYMSFGPGGPCQRCGADFSFATMLRGARWRRRFASWVARLLRLRGRAGL